MGGATFGPFRHQVLAISSATPRPFPKRRVDGLPPGDVRLVARWTAQSVPHGRRPGAVGRRKESAPDAALRGGGGTREQLLLEDHLEIARVRARDVDVVGVDAVVVDDGGAGRRAEPRGDVDVSHSRILGR